MINSYLHPMEDKDRWFGKRFWIQVGGGFLLIGTLMLSLIYFANKSGKAPKGNRFPKEESLWGNYDSVKGAPR